MVFNLPGAGVSGNIFLHQLGVAASGRRRGVAQALFFYLFDKLPGFEVLELTIDRKNIGAQKLFRTIAACAGLQLLKTPEVVELLEEGCEEEVYVMRSAGLTPSLAVGEAGNPRK
jgi:hypothetical protein